MTHPSAHPDVWLGCTPAQHTPQRSSGAFVVCLPQKVSLSGLHRLPRGVAVDRLQPIEELLCRHARFPLVLRAQDRGIGVGGTVPGLVRLFARYLGHSLVQVRALSQGRNSYGS